MNVIKGSIGFLGLENWWNHELSSKERDTIIRFYNPMGSSSKDLIEGDISWTSEEPISLIYGIASWLNSYENLGLCMKIFLKAKSLTTENTQAKIIHFLHGNEIKIYYRHRDRIGLEPTIAACEQQIKISDKVAIEFINDNIHKLELTSSEIFYTPDALPSHIGYKQLSIIMEKSHQYQRAIDLCTQAQAQGWSGDWERRIDRYKKKINKHP